MGRILTPGYLQTVQRGLSAVFNKELTSENGVAALHTLLCLPTSSDGADEEYDWMGDMPVLDEIRGERPKKNLQTKQVIVTNKEFDALIGIKRATLERDKLNLYKPRLQQIGASARKWFDKRLFTVMVERGWGGDSGAAGTKYVDWTGKAYFAASKALAKDKGAGTFTNAVTTALNATSFEAGIASLQTRVDANGETLDLGDDGFLLVCGPSNRSTALKLLKAENVSDGTTTVSNVNAGAADLRIWNRLTGSYANYWFLFAKSAGRAPFIAQTEVPPSTYMCTDPNDSHVIKNKEFLFQVYARGEVGLGESLLAYGSTGAG